MMTQPDKLTLEEIEMIMTYREDWANPKTIGELCQQLSDSMRENERLRSLLDGLLNHDFAEECQECGIGQSMEWIEAKQNKESDNAK